MVMANVMAIVIVMYDARTLEVRVYSFSYYYFVHQLSKVPREKCV